MDEEWKRKGRTDERRDEKFIHTIQAPELRFLREETDSGQRPMGVDGRIQSQGLLVVVRLVFCFLNILQQHRQRVEERFTREKGTENPHQQQQQHRIAWRWLVVLLQQQCLSSAIHEMISVSVPLPLIANH